MNFSVETRCFAALHNIKISMKKMSKRLLKREKHNILEKELRALHTKERELCKESHITIELEKPLFVGYEKFFVFRSDVLGRPDFPIMEKLLTQINTVLSSENKHFTKKVRRKTKLANREKGKKTIDIEHKTKDLEVHEWEKLSAKEKAFFFPTTSTKYRNYTTGVRTVFRWFYPWMLVAKTKKSYVTSIKVRNPDIESENAYIDALLEQRNLRGKMGKLLYGHYKYRYSNRESMRSSLREKEMKKDMRRELAELTPSVFEPFYPDFKVLKTSKPKYSEKNNSAFLLVIFYEICDIKPIIPFCFSNYKSKLFNPSRRCR